MESVSCGRESQWIAKGIAIGSGPGGGEADIRLMLYSVAWYYRLIARGRGGCQAESEEKANIGGVGLRAALVRKSEQMKVHPRDSLWVCSNPQK
jgi:hypothetical protein